MIYVGLQRVPSKYTVHANRFLYFLNILLKKVVTEIQKHGHILILDLCCE